MHGQAPLLRIVPGILPHSSSRIPHLTTHIVRRQARVPSQNHGRRWTEAASHAQRRHQHTFLSLDDTLRTLGSLFDAHGGYEKDAAGGVLRPASSEQRASEASEAQPVEATKTLTVEDLLAENHPERILHALTGDFLGHEFVLSADDETFTRAICALDPNYFIMPYRDIYHIMKRSLEVGPMHRFVRSLEERYTTFTNILDNIISTRREAGHKLTLDDYRHVLRCAASCGYGNMARVMFHTMMPEDGVQPDLDCFNYFMEAINWNQAYNRFERYNLRVIPRNLRYRSMAQRQQGFTGYGVATPQNPNNPDSIRLQALKAFNELSRQGFKGNERTFCQLMIAFGREGDLSSVKSVLKSVWNIDIDLLQKFDEEEVESPTFYDTGHPLRPTSLLLHSLVHIFGTNNDSGLAAMLVDYVSRNYDIEISKSIWIELLQASYVLTRQWVKVSEDPTLRSGVVKPDVFQNLIQACTDEPYNVPQDVRILTYRARIEKDRHEMAKSFEAYQQAIEVLDDERTKLSILYEKLKHLVLTKRSLIFQDGLPSVEFLQLRKKFVLASLHVDCDLQLISTGLRSAFKKPFWALAWGDLQNWWPVRPTLADIDPRFDQYQWPTRDLPKYLHQFEEYVPNKLPYYTPTGYIELEGKMHRRSALKAANDMQTTKVGQMRTMFDTLSPEHLRQMVQRYRQCELDKTVDRQKSKIVVDSTKELELELRAEREKSYHGPASDFHARDRFEKGPLHSVSRSPWRDRLREMAKKS